MRSSTSSRASGDVRERRNTLWLWLGALAGPLVWLLLLQTNYVLSYVACETRQTWFLYLTTIVAAGVVGAAGFLAWRAGHSPRALEEPRSGPLSPETPDARARWMAIFAVASCAWFIIVILSAFVRVAVLRTCQ